MAGQGAVDVICGGWSPVASASGNAEIQGYLDDVRGAAEKAAKRTFEMLLAVEYISQVVEGMNYIIKANTGGGVYAFIRLFVSLPVKGGKCTVSFDCLRDHKKEDDKLEPFDGPPDCPPPNC